MHNCTCLPKTSVAHLTVSLFLVVCVQTSKPKQNKNKIQHQHQNQIKLKNETQISIEMTKITAQLSWQLALAAIDGSNWRVSNYSDIQFFFLLMSRKNNCQVFNRFYHGLKSMLKGGKLIIRKIEMACKDKKQ